MVEQHAKEVEKYRLEKTAVDIQKQYLQMGEKLVGLTIDSIDSEMPWSASNQN